MTSLLRPGGGAAGRQGGTCWRVTRDELTTLLSRPPLVFPLFHDPLHRPLSQVSSRPRCGAVPAGLLYNFQLWPEFWLHVCHYSARVQRSTFDLGFTVALIAVCNALWLLQQTLCTRVARTPRFPSCVNTLGCDSVYRLPAAMCLADQGRHLVHIQSLVTRRRPILTPG